MTFDRHGSFFELYNQWYFACNDQSWPGTSPFYRDSVIGYVHFRDNGEIEPIYLNRTGVGQYDGRNAIPAENYFRGLGVTQKQSPEGGFEVRNIIEGTVLAYPNVSNLPIQATMSLRLACGNHDGATIEVPSGSPDGPLLGTIATRYRAQEPWANYPDDPMPAEQSVGQDRFVSGIPRQGGGFAAFEIDVVQVNSPGYPPSKVSRPDCAPGQSSESRAKPADRRALAKVTSDNVLFDSTYTARHIGFLHRTCPSYPRSTALNPPSIKSKN